MKRAALLAVLAIVGTTACKKSNEAAAPAPAPVAATPAAPAKDPWQKPAPKKDPLPHPLLWSAEKDGKTTYLLGTIHMGVDPMTRLPDVVWSKLDSSPAFAMETDLSDHTAQEIMMKPAPVTVHEQIGDADWKKVEDLIGAPIASRLDKLQPATIASMIEVKFLPSTPPMDPTLSAHAANSNKPIHYLESAVLQVNLLNKWLDKRALKVLLADVDGTKQHVQELLAAYVAGDEAAMLKLDDESRAEALKQGYTPAEYDQEMNEMLYNRNASWIPEIEKMHAEGGSFVAVGAMHLIGDKGVVSLLQKDGFKIARVQ